MPSTNPPHLPGSPSPGDGLSHDLADLAAHAARLRDLIARARDSAPATATGRDASGIAIAEITGTGVPAVLRLASPWSPRLRPEELGAALLEAYQGAVRDHLSRWAHDLQRDGWHHDVRDLDQRRPPPVPAGAVVPFEVPVAVGTPRPLSRLVDDTLRELDRAHDLTRVPQPPPPPTRPSADRVRVVLNDAGLTDVHIDARWAVGRHAAAINGELASALRQALLTTVGSTSTIPGAAEHDQLLGEVLQLLHQHREGRRAP